jgi:serine/threonine-protein kinase
MLTRQSPLDDPTAGTPPVAAASSSVPVRQPASSAPAGAPPASAPAGTVPRARPSASLPAAPATQPGTTPPVAPPAATTATTATTAPTAATVAGTPVQARGGTIRVGCDGSTTTVLAVDPAAGYTITDQDAGPASEVQVVLLSAANESEIKVKCKGGSPKPKIKESPQ